MTDLIHGIPGSEQLRMPPQDAQTWRATLDSMAYAPRIRCPSSTSAPRTDFYGAMDFVDQRSD